MLNANSVLTKLSLSSKLRFSSKNYFMENNVGLMSSVAFSMQTLSFGLLSGVSCGTATKSRCKLKTYLHILSKTASHSNRLLISAN